MSDVLRAASPILINASPRPRVLVHGFDDDVVSRIGEFVPTVRVLVEGLDEVRQEEWDALITRSDLTGAAEHLFAVVQAPGQISGYWTAEAIAPGLWIRLYTGHVAEELLRYKDLPDRVAQLTHEILEPIAKARDSHTYFTEDRSRPVVRSASGAIAVPAEKFKPELRPFLATADKHVLAGSYKRRHGAQVWLLPEDVPDVVPWVRAAVGEWHHLDATRFPGLPDWSHEPHWQTHRERRYATGLASLDAERRNINDYFDRRASQLRSELDSARSDADLYERALLTADSDELVEAVIRALRELGFIVDNADDHAQPGDNLEDLQIADPDQPNWLVIAEVKGYTKGASTAAFQQLARFSKRYLQRTGTSPDAEWYIANQFRKQDPSSRQQMLHGKGEDVQVFAADGGLIIDTAVLFRTIEQVRADALTAAEARAHFRTSSGIATAPVAS